MKLKLLTTFGIIIFCLNFNAFSQSTDLAGLETRTADAVEWPSDNNLITRPKMGSSEGKDTEAPDKSLPGWFHNLNILSAACNAAQTHTLPVCNNNATSGNTLDDYFSFNVTGTIADGSGNYGVGFTDISRDGCIDFYNGKYNVCVTDPAAPRRVNELFIHIMAYQRTEEAAPRGMKNAKQSRITICQEGAT